MILAILNIQSISLGFDNKIHVCILSKVISYSFVLYMIILITFTLLQMDMRITAFIGLFILFINWSNGQDPNSEMEKAEKGIEAGTAILSMFDSDSTTKFVSYLGI